LTGAEIVVKILEQQGVKRIFGIPGAQSLELFDAFRGAGIETILVTHELCASFMADATSRAGDGVGVAVVVPGPGLTNIFSGLGESYLDSIPMVVIIAGVNNEIPYSFQLHEIDQVKAASPLAKAVYRLEKVEEIWAQLTRAFSLAQSGEPGPVVVEIPNNLLARATSFSLPPINGKENISTSPIEPLISRAIQAITDAKRVGIYAGLGAFPAGREIRELAELLDAPVATTLSGRGVIPEDHPLSVGYGFGGSGTRISRKTFSECDLILAVGCKFTEVGTGGYGLKIPGKLIHIDANPGNLNVNYKAEVAIASDSKAALDRILAGVREIIKSPRKSGLREEIRKAKAEEEQKLESRDIHKDWVDPAHLLRHLRQLLPRDAIITTDSGHHMFFVLTYFPIYEPRTYLAPTDYQSMGYSVPAAIGARLACPGRRVVATVGDGGFLMTGIEMLTASRLKLDLPVIVFNDGALGLIKKLQKRALLRTQAVDLVETDFESYARAVGAGYIRIENDEEIAGNLEKALALKGPVLIDAWVQYPELTDYIKGQILENIKRYPAGQKFRSLVRLFRRAVLPWAE
jgi:acetolactate synthase-1/2/3 large subunit